MGKGPEKYTRLEREVNGIVEQYWPTSFQATQRELYELTFLVTLRLAYLKETGSSIEDEKTAIKRLGSFLSEELVKNGPEKFPQIDELVYVNFNALEMDTIGESVLHLSNGHGFVPQKIQNPGEIFLSFQDNFVKHGGRMNSEIVKDIKKAVKK